jgi:hypothetical protein
MNHKKILLSVAFFISSVCNAVPVAQGYGANLLQSPSAGVDAIEHYLVSTDMAILMCSTAVRIAIAHKKAYPDSNEDAPNSDYQACIKEYSLLLIKLHSGAQKTTKKPLAKTALKEHFVLAASALQGVAPLPAERVIDYERRTNAEKRSLDQQKIRFAAEL